MLDLSISFASDGPVVGLVELHLFSDIVEKLISEGNRVLTDPL